MQYSSNQFSSHTIRTHTYTLPYTTALCHICSAMSRPASTPALPDCVSTVQEVFPDLAPLMEEFRGQSLRDFVPRPMGNPNGGGCLENTAAPHTWDIDENKVSLTVKPIEWVQEGDLQEGDSQKQQPECPQERYAQLIQYNNGFQCFVICDNTINKTFIEFRQNNGTIISTLSVRPTMSHQPPPTQWTNEPFLLTSSQQNETIPSGLVEGQPESQASGDLPRLEAPLKLEVEPLLLHLSQASSDAAGTGRGLSGFALTRMDHSPSSQDGPSVLREHFTPFFPHLHTLRDKTIEGYLQHLQADPTSSVKVQPCGDAVKTWVTTPNAKVVVTEKGNHRFLNIVLNSGVGEINLLETFGITTVSTIGLENSQAEIAISEHQSANGVHGAVCSSLGMWNLTGDTIHFLGPNRSRVTLPEASTGPGSIGSPKQTTNGLDSIQAQLPPHTEGDVYPSGSSGDCL